MSTKSTDLELAAKHRYRLPSGELAVNVTTISGLLDDGKSGAMAGAAVKLTKAGADYRAEWRAKADTGTRVHSVCEAWLTGKDADVRDEDAGYVDALEKFWLDHTPAMIECEAVALSERGYGGRFDVVAILSDGRTHLLDLKSGKPYPVEHTLQLAAYRYCDGIGVYDETGMLADLRPMPEVDACGCLYVHEDGTYDLVPYPADLNAFTHFCALLAVHQWAKSVKKEAAP